MPFVHLRVPPEYSVVDSTRGIDAAAAAARADAMPALAITDLSNLFGAVKFYKACRGAGVKPLIGVDVWLEPVAEADKQASRLLLLVQDAVGYHNAVSYTHSDAADERSSVDLGGRRHIKKKKKKKKRRLQLKK